MFTVLDIANRFLAFVTYELVPFFTEVQDAISVPYFDVDWATLDVTINHFNIPWFFGNLTIGEWLLIGGVIGIFGLRLIKFMTGLFK